MVYFLENTFSTVGCYRPLYS